MQPPKVQPSSLVFVAIVGSWAAYLLPRWVGRRDALGQARGRDRHSTRLRVLNRRRRGPAGRSTAALLTTPQGVPRAPAPERRTGSPAAFPDPSAVRRARARRAAARRTRVLGLLLALTVGSVALVAVTPAPLWTPAPAGALLLLDLIALVAAGRRRAATRRAVARDVARDVALRALAARRRVEAARAADPVVAAGARRGSARTAVAQSAVSARAGSAPVDGAVAASGTDRPDGAGRATPSRLVPVPPLRPAAVALAASASRASWTPVAVPPPTYTLKPVARRAEPRPLDLTPPAPPASAQPAPRPWDVDPVTQRPWADELDLDLVLARRRAVNG